MSGAAMNYRQDPGLRSQHQDSSSLHNPGYHLQINREPNLQQLNSKTLNYPSFSTNFPVVGIYDNFHQYEKIDNSRHSIREGKDPRFQRPRTVRNRSEPIDLPVPQFEIDEHSVSDPWKTTHALVQGSKGLDLDTRIGLLIKSKALAGMHPIFSDLNDSEESESDPDDNFLNRSRSKFRKKSKSTHTVQKDIEVPIRESFDDPEKPLSRPPSPFLSRATYLFWFNKAIEIKQQAKAQEQALLEQAAKRLIQDGSTPMKTNQLEKPSQKMPVLNNLMDEISKELKEVIKQEFIREVIEQTAFNTLDDWWEKQNQEEKIGDTLKNETEPLKTVSNISSENCQDLCIVNSESHRSTSPKMPFPWTKDFKQPSELKGGENVKHSCLTETTSGNKTLSKNPEENFVDVHSVSKNKDIISVSSINQESRPEESISQVLQKNCEVSHQEDSSFEACYNHKINSRSCEMPSESMNLINSEVSSSSGTCTTEIFLESSEVNYVLPLNAKSSLGVKIDETTLIVKDVLEFIFNNVNRILVQRNDNKSS